MPDKKSSDLNQHASQRSDRLPTDTGNVSDKRSIEQFINQVRQMPAKAGQGRLVFALDATASREATWDQACELQSELFLATRDLGGLAIQLCYYRGYGEFKATRFVTQTEQLLKLMNGVRCLGGITQIN